MTAKGTENLSYAQTRHSSLRAPTRGVRCLREETEWIDEVRAVALVLPSDAAFSHITAAAIQGLPLPSKDAKPFHVTTPTGRIRRRDVRHHRRPLEDDVEVIDELPVTTPLRTWRDAAACLAVPDLVAIADVLLRRTLATREQLEDLRWVRHRSLLSEAAGLANGRSRSPRESLLRVALHYANLPTPQVNMAIIHDGTWVGEGDLVWPAYGVIADYDGGHHEEPDQRHQDAQTRDDYASLGWRHVPVTKKMGLEASVERIRRALYERGWRAA